MTDLQTLTDRIEIDALRSEYNDAAMMHDHARFAALFTEDAVYRIPAAGIEHIGRERILSGFERMADAWEFLVQTTHHGVLELDGDTATGRVYVSELGRLRDGMSVQNHALFHDRYRRTADGWRFSERVYEVRYYDTTPLTGSPEVVPHGR